MQCVVNMQDFCEFKMQNSSPDLDPPGSSILYNDSGYITHLQSYSSNSNSDPSCEAAEEISLHNQVQSTNGIYFCEDAVFDEPKLEGPPLLSHNTNNYEQFSSLIKFSLEETSSSYLNETNLLQDSSNSSYYNKPTTVLQYFDQDSLSSYSSINPSQPICVSENKENIVSQAVQQCLTHSDTEFSEINQSEKCTDNSSNRTSPLSPELFSEDEIEHDSLIEINSEEYTNPKNVSFSEKRASLDDNCVRDDRVLLKRVLETLSGVPPPPSVTILQLSASELLQKIQTNSHLFLTEQDLPKKSTRSLIVSHTKQQIQGVDFPEIMNYRYHGLHWNRGVVSEELESGCMRYLSRYVGCETASTVTWCGGVEPTGAAARRHRGPPKSPGRRLAHLARRRITFSSANLHQQQQGAGGMSVLGNGVSCRQLMIDPRKPSNRRRSPRKSPWKRSPRKTPSKRTPKKPSLTPTTRVSSTKRALFQSPDKGPAVGGSRRRALFQSPPDEGQGGKRKRALFQSPPDEGQGGNSSSKRRKQEEEGRKGKHKGKEGKKGELSDLHRQKLLWAVSAALRSHGVSSSHPQFRAFASVLCKVVKHQVPDLTSGTLPRQAGSTSERLLRLARKHCHAVTRGHTVLQVLQQAQATHTHTHTHTQNAHIHAQTQTQASHSRTHTATAVRNDRVTTVKRQICFDDPNR